MDKTRFSELLRRLEEAFPRAEMNEVRADALWQQYGRKLAPEVWDRAVTSLATGSRWPTPKEIDAAIELAYESTSKQSVSAKACQCGGRLEQLDMKGCWYPAEPFEGSYLEGAIHRKDHPEAWSVATLFACTSCQARYAVATEDFTFTRIDGTRGKVKKGTMKECSAWFERQMWPAPDAEMVT